MSKNFKDRTGEVHTTNEGYEIEIIEYYGVGDCTIKFESGFIMKNVNYSNIIKKSIRYPYHPSVCGIGFIGEGVYKSVKNKIVIKMYTKWNSVFDRCYQKNSLKNPTYIDCHIDERWHNFQNFAQWWMNNYNPKYMEKWCLDKDILIKGNKVYSPETCCFVPHEINLLFKKERSRQEGYPVGVRKSNSRFEARIRIKSKELYIGTFDTIDEASEAYKIAKVRYIKEIAEEYKGRISQEVYNILINYTI